jgi:hypothetical protein
VGGNDIVYGASDGWVLGYIKTPMVLGKKRTSRDHRAIATQAY